MSDAPDSARLRAEVDALRTKLGDAERLIRDVMADRGRVLLEQVERSSVLSAQMRRSEIMDGSTMLLRHGVFRARLEFEVRRSKNTGRAVGCIFADIDSFSAFNRTYSYEHGDTALATIGRSLEGLWLARPAALPAVFGREGGDCFGVIQPDASAEELEWRSEEIRELVERFPLQPGRLTVSVGAALLGPAETSDELLLRLASNLEVAKATGNATCFR